MIRTAGARIRRRAAGGRWRRSAAASGDKACLHQLAGGGPADGDGGAVGFAEQGLDPEQGEGEGALHEAHLHGLFGDRLQVVNLGLGEPGRRGSGGRAKLLLLGDEDQHDVGLPRVSGFRSYITSSLMTILGYVSVFRSNLTVCCFYTFKYDN